MIRARFQDGGEDPGWSDGPEWSGRNELLTWPPPQIDTKHHNHRESATLPPSLPDPSLPLSRVSKIQIQNYPP